MRAGFRRARILEMLTGDIAFVLGASPAEGTMAALEFTREFGIPRRQLSLKVTLERRRSSNFVFSGQCPLYPRKRTSLSAIVQCPLWAKSGLVHAAKRSLFDHLVGARNN